MNKKTTTLQIIGMHCTSCAINIDFELEDLDGVHIAKTHYAKSVSTVTFDPQKISHKHLIDAISKLGYDAVVADEG